jgi:hypothetical protein
LKKMDGNNQIDYGNIDKDQSGTYFL